ncbi:hypothetical protein ACVIYL_009007 [Bradyrhizobium sp. USDA 3315]
MPVAQQGPQSFRLAHHFYRPKDRVNVYLDTTSSFGPFVRGPKMPIVVSTIVMDPAINANTPVTPRMGLRSRA